jgi:hypothetical protein
MVKSALPAAQNELILNCHMNPAHSHLRPYPAECFRWYIEMIPFNIGEEKQPAVVHF